MYRPPLKKSEVAVNNPFKTKTIVNSSLMGANSEVLPIGSSKRAIAYNTESADVIRYT